MASAPFKRSSCVGGIIAFCAGGFQGRGMPGRGGSFGSFGMSAGMDGGGPMMMEMGANGLQPDARPLVWCRHKDGSKALHIVTVVHM